MPRIAAVMTPFPYSLEPGDPLDKARRLMREHGFRHLPVTDGGRPVGLITDHHIHRAAAGESGRQAAVGDVERSAGYVVDLSAPLDLVLDEMARRHQDAALVVKGGKLVGIFTASDACRGFAEQLRREHPPAGGSDAA